MALGRLQPSVSLQLRRLTQIRIWYKVLSMMLDTWYYLYNCLTKAIASLALLHCPLQRYFCGEWTLHLQVIEGTDCVNTLLLWCTVLLLVPTRELALQTSQVCKELAKHLNIQIMVTTGGTSLRDDIMRLYQPVHLLVGTPGRVLDLANKGVCNLRECTMLVMDEVRAGPLIYWSSGS
jgi:hypothetical protein